MAYGHSRGSSPPARVPADKLSVALATRKAPTPPQAPPWAPASRPVTGSCAPHTLAGSSVPASCLPPWGPCGEKSFPKDHHREGGGLVTQTYSLKDPTRFPLGKAKARHRVPLNSMPTFSSPTSSQPNLWQPCGPSPVLGTTHGPNYPRSAWLIHGNSQPHPNTKAPSVTKLLNGINPIPTTCSLVRLPSNTCSVIAFRPSAGPSQRCPFPVS